jgi:hypothetical protein
MYTYVISSIKYQHKQLIILFSLKIQNVINSDTIAQFLMSKI